MFYRIVKIPVYFVVCRWMALTRIGGTCGLSLSETNTHVTFLQTLSQIWMCLVVSHITTQSYSFITCLLYPFILLSPKINTFYVLLNDTWKLYGKIQGSHCERKPIDIWEFLKLWFLEKAWKCKQSYNVFAFCYCCYLYKIHI